MNAEEIHASERPQPGATKWVAVKRPADGEFFVAATGFGFMAVWQQRLSGPRRVSRRYWTWVGALNAYTRLVPTEDRR